MCLICVDFEKGKLTIEEAYNNLKEVFNEEDKHTQEVWEMLIEAELKKLEGKNEN